MCWGGGGQGCIRTGGKGGFGCDPPPPTVYSTSYFTGGPRGGGGGCSGPGRVPGGRGGGARPLGVLRHPALCIGGTGTRAAGGGDQGPRSLWSPGPGGRGIGVWEGGVRMGLWDHCTSAPRRMEGPVTCHEAEGAMDVTHIFGGGGQVQPPTAWATRGHSRAEPLTPCPPPPRHWAMPPSQRPQIC